ncbi:hypothetical protein DFH94DRAFT_848017 [Russula ochroleuca]|uniref:Uncharacterized protein n=1 Tax=Russula ochroleuca TaxID=152965 RepID=A0A9P5MQS8_9AGAM|nr:hypothetical protein DFH94DRAFT_848017 [Russula ochroleuca]
MPKEKTRQPETTNFPDFVGCMRQYSTNVAVTSSQPLASTQNLAPWFKPWFPRHARPSLAHFSANPAADQVITTLSFGHVSVKLEWSPPMTSIPGIKHCSDVARENAAAPFPLKCEQQTIAFPKSSSNSANLAVRRTKTDASLLALPSPPGKLPIAILTAAGVPWRASVASGPTSPPRHSSTPKEGDKALINLPEATAFEPRDELKCVACFRVSSCFCLGDSFVYGRNGSLRRRSWQGGCSLRQCLREGSGIVMLWTASHINWSALSSWSGIRFLFVASHVRVPNLKGRAMQGRERHSPEDMPLYSRFNRKGGRIGGVQGRKGLRQGDEVGYSNSDG